jgi:hypothetical protein
MPTATCIFPTTTTNELNAYMNEDVDISDPAHAKHATMVGWMAGVTGREEVGTRWVFCFISIA